MKNILLLVVICFLFACESAEGGDKDKTPPERPRMIEHLGDLGDPSSTFTDNNNGTDAVAGESDAIKIVWEPLIDSDLDYLAIYRFSFYDTNPVKIDSIGIAYETPPESYIDYFEIEGESPIVGTEWFYFVHSFDRAGNFAESDTVSYVLAEKSSPFSPYENQVFSTEDEIVFKWNLGGNIQHCRVLVFNENGSIAWIPDYDWYYDSEEEPEVLLSYDLSPGTYKWRIDSFGSNNSGSESPEVVFVVQ